MKYLLTVAILLTTAVLLYAAASPGAVTYVGHDKVGEALVKGGALANGEGFTASGNHRSGPGQVEVHEKETDIFYVPAQKRIESREEMIGGKTTGPNQVRGSDIQGGQAHHLTKGDVISIPAGTPHWFKEVPKSVSYFTVKVIKP